MGSAIAAQVKAAKTFNNSSNCLDGRYTYLIKRIVETVDRNKIPFFIAELRVVEGAPADVADILRAPSEAGKEIVYSRPGSEVSFKVKFQNDSAAGNVKGFVQALEGLSDSDWEDASGKDLFMGYMDAVISDAQPFRGFLIFDTTFRTRTQKGKNPGSLFTGHNWKMHPSNSKDEVAQRRAALDAEEKAAAR